MTLAVYTPALSFGSVYEEGLLLTPREAVQTPNRLVDRLRRALVLDVRHAHAVNIALHLVNGLLLWALAQAIVPPATAILAMGLFLLNPLQVEAVAYLSALPELVAACWVLLAVLAVERRWIALAWVCAACAVTGKEVGLVSFALVPLWAWWRGQVWPVPTRLIWAGTCWLITLGFMGGAGMRGWLGGIGPLFTVSHLTQATRLLALSVESLWHPQALTIDHDWSWITRPIAWSVAAGWGLALITAARRAWPIWGFALLWALVALAPRILIGFPDDLHERHIYTATLMGSLALASLILPSKGRA